MEIRVKRFGKSWGIEVAAANGRRLFDSTAPYANRRNALACARLLAEGEFTLVVRE